MRTLSLDFASHEGHIACCNGAVCALRSVERANDAEFIPLLEGVLKEAGWKASDIERIACNLGPGGFTSVRGGVTFANALADQLHVPVAGYHGSELSLARAPADVWAHSTKTDQLFVRGGTWKEPTLVMLDMLLGAVKKGMTVTGDLLPVHRDAVLKIGGILGQPALIIDVLPGFLDALVYSNTLLVPWYGRGL